MPTTSTLNLRRLPPVAPTLTSQALWAGIKASFDKDDTVIETFATSLTQYMGAKGTFLAASGRTVLYLLLKELRQQRPSPARQEVVLPAYTCPALVKVIQAAGLTCRLCDVSPHTLDFDREQLHKVVNEKTLVIIVVHPFGIPQAMQDVIALADKVGALVIEDAAQAMAARLDGRMVGTWGTIGLTSLGAGKALSTGGGGIAIANDEQSLKLCRRVWQALPSGSSITALVQLLITTIAFHPVGWWWISHLGIDQAGNHASSWGFRQHALSSAQAGVGERLLFQLDDINHARQQQASRWQNALKGIPAIHFPEIVTGAEPIYVRFPLLITDSEDREAIFDILRREGIGVGKMYQRPLNDIFPSLADRDYPGACTLAKQLLTLPTHRFVSEGDVKRSAAALLTRTYPNR